MGQPHSSGSLFALFVGIHSAKVYITDCVSCVHCLTHFSSCLGALEAAYREEHASRRGKRGHKHVCLPAPHEPGHSERPAVTSRTPKHQNPPAVHMQINSRENCCHVSCGLMVHFSVLHSQYDPHIPITGLFSTETTTFGLMTLYECLSFLSQTIIKVLWMCCAIVLDVKILHSAVNVTLLSLIPLVPMSETFIPVILFCLLRMADTSSCIPYLFKTLALSCTRFFHTSSTLAAH